MIPVFRILYGDFDYGKGKASGKLVKEVKYSLTNEWAKKNVCHLVLGKKNFEFLKQLGAKNVVLCGKAPVVISTEKMCHFYNKSFLIKEAIEKYSDGEAIVIDFDTTLVKNPDEKMVEILRNKTGKFNGTLQCPVAGYKCRVCLQKKDGGFRIEGQHALRSLLNTSFVYCRDKKWIEDLLKEYSVYQDMKKSVIFLDEQVLIYMLDKNYGIMTVEDLVENFEPGVMEVNRNVPEAKATKKDQEIYFNHF